MATWRPDTPIPKRESDWYALMILDVVLGESTRLSGTPICRRPFSGGEQEFLRHSPHVVLPSRRLRQWHLGVDDAR
jgi:hypothetical protein